MNRSKPKPQGRCVFCNKLFAGGGLSRHLGTHLASIPEVKDKQAYHLRVSAGPYFLQLLMDGKAPLQKLDRFLRKIWLECCGHMSQFTYEKWGEEIPMDFAAKRVFDPGQSLYHAYDFGSTTELTVKCIKTYPVKVPGSDAIQLLSRNEPIARTCDHCQENIATEMCPVHLPEEEMFFCKACSEIHLEECPDADYAMSRMYNSPRSGVCGYDGGRIDVERDGVLRL